MAKLLQSPFRKPLQPVMHRTRSNYAPITGVGWWGDADLWKDHVANRGTLTDPTDTHTQTIRADDQAGDFTAFTANQLVRTNKGLQSVQTYTQYAANPQAPASQTVTLSSTGTYTLWMQGSGSIAVAANTAIGSGFGTALAGQKVTFTISTGGTVDLTVNGSPSLVQVINKAFVQPPIMSASSVTGNLQVFSTGIAATAGVRGFATFFIRDPGSGFINLLRLYDSATGNNRFLLFHATGKVFANLTAGGVNQGDLEIGPWQTGLTTIAYAAGANFFTARIVGQSNPTPDTSGTFNAMNRLATGGAGLSATSNTFLNTRGQALWFGAPDAANFADTFARAEQAHAYFSGFSEDFTGDFG